MSALHMTTGRVLVKLCECGGDAPAHLDVVAGAARPLSSIDRGSLDRCVHHHASAMRVRRVFHASRALAHEGYRAEGFDDAERDIGLDRVIALEISSPQRAYDLADDLNDRDDVEWAMPEPLSLAPMALAPVRSFDARGLTVEQIRSPFERVGAFEALAMEPGDPAINVAVVDTGVALRHPELTPRISAGVDTVDLGAGPIGGGAELVGDSDHPDIMAYDETGHGSHVAGIIAAQGYHMPQGIGGRSRLVPVRALAAARGPDGQIVGIGGTMDIDAAVKAAVDLGARVLNLSFGTAEADLPDDTPPVHSDTIRYAIARGAVPVAAMGNSGRHERYFPAALDGVIAVGAMRPDGQAASFSTRGEHITLCAPGEDVVSTGLSGYRASTGTSHAAPFVAGTVALMLARADRAGVQLSAHDCRDLLCRAATPAAPGRHTDETGAGLLNAPRTLSLLDEFIATKNGGSYGR
ncbi:S8 family serine peptidase [Yoonia sp.]|uniref:S8 family peptidase n=1 Tax=Yoonia sp. TaxID=2212373 RepID=UPI00358FCB2C